MGDNWQDDPAMKRAAFIGMIGNGSIPAADRIAMAQQVIRELEAELESATERIRQLTKIELHVWTRHGHLCCRDAPLSAATRPKSIIRCGGPRLCSKCADEASAAHDRNTVIDD